MLLLLHISRNISNSTIKYLSFFSYGIDSKHLKGIGNCPRTRQLAPQCELGFALASLAKLSTHIGVVRGTSTCIEKMAETSSNR